MYAVQIHHVAIYALYFVNAVSVDVTTTIVTRVTHQLEISVQHLFVSLLFPMVEGFCASLVHFLSVLVIMMMLFFALLVESALTLLLAHMNHRNKVRNFTVICCL